MRIIIVGQGPFGEKVLEAMIQNREEVIGVFCPPDKRGDPMKAVAEKAGIPLLRPTHMKNPEVYDAFVSLQPDLVVEAFVTDIFPERLLTVPKIGTICYHPSLLPRHRGASGINWAIIMGDTRTALTIFWVDKGIDTGPILLQKEVEIGPDETTGSLYFNKLFPMGVDAMVEAVELIKQGKATRIPQDESKATYEPPCDDRVAALDFEKPARDVYNFIRGCDPQPGAFSYINGRKVRFYDARMSEGITSGLPGQVIGLDQKTLQIAAKGGVLRVGRLRPDKGEKMSPLEFARSLNIQVGDRFVSQ